MVEKGLVSVIIPTYNREEKLLRAIESVKKQSYGKIDLIVVDDNSDIDIDGLISSVEGIDIKLYKNKRNRGANYCRAKGVDLASGEYVLFLDSDDELLPSACEKLMNEAKNSNCGAVFPSFDIVREGVVQQTKFVEPKDAELKSLYDYGNTLGGFTGSFFKKSLLDDNMLFDFKLDKAQDLDMYIKFIKLYNACTMPDVLYRHNRDQHARISNSPERTINGHLRLLHKYHGNFSSNHIAHRLRTIGIAFLSLNEVEIANFYFKIATSQHTSTKQMAKLHQKIGVGYLKHGHCSYARAELITSLIKNPSLKTVFIILLTLLPNLIVEKILYYRRKLGLSN